MPSLQDTLFMQALKRARDKRILENQKYQRIREEAEVALGLGSVGVPLDERNLRKFLNLIYPKNLELLLRLNDLVSSTDMEALANHLFLLCPSPLDYYTECSYLRSQLEKAITGLANKIFREYMDLRDMKCNAIVTLAYMQGKNFENFSDLDEGECHRRSLSCAHPSLKGLHEQPEPLGREHWSDLYERMKVQIKIKEGYITFLKINYEGLKKILDDSIRTPALAAEGGSEGDSDDDSEGGSEGE